MNTDPNFLRHWLSGRTPSSLGIFQMVKADNSLPKGKVKDWVGGSAPRESSASVRCAGKIRSRRGHTFAPSGISGAPTDRESSSFPQFSVGGPSVLLTLLLLAADTEYSMARYSAFLGRRVEVQYRAGDILLPASGTFVADSGRSIFLEQNFEQRGQHKHFRWEIPYQYLVRIEAKPDSGTSANGTSITAAPKAAPEAPAESKAADKALSAAATASAGGASGILPLSRGPKTA